MEFGSLDPQTNSRRNCESELDPTQEWGVRLNVAPQDAELGAVLRPIRVSSKPRAPQTHKRIIHSYPHAAAFPHSLPMFHCVPISHQGFKSLLGHTLVKSAKTTKMIKTLKYE